MRLLPTPTATNSSGNGHNNRGDQLLPGVVSMLLPTPRASDSDKAGGPNQRGSAGDLALMAAVMSDRWGMYGPAIRRQETIFGRPAPEPTVTGKRGGQRLSGRFVEWMMGWPDGWVTDLVDNKAALRIGGNGPVPQQALAAWRSLSTTREAS